MEARVAGTRQLPANPTGPVVVIDVLRAFTTAAWVLDRGASMLALAATDEEALRLKHRLGTSAVAVKDGALIEGFELGNSPGQAQRADLAGRPVVQRTSNGTVAVHAARRAPLRLCASLVNATATARRIRRERAGEVIYVVTGDDGTAEEDLICAKYIHALVENREPPRDARERVERSAAADELRRGLDAGYLGIHPEDIALACAIDAFDFAMIAIEADGLIRISRT